MPIFYGVGVGTGDPELLTLKALRILREVPVIGIPRRSPYDPSFAWTAVEPSLGEVPGQERLSLIFPMTKDPTVLLPAWEKALDEIGERFAQGKSVAFITAGDPFVYSTFIYLYEGAAKRWPDLRREVVPGISSITACAAALGIPLADGKERIAVLPATYGVDDLAEILEKFDTVILMKVNNCVPKVVKALERTELLDKAVYISKATTRQQKVVRNLKSIEKDRCDYFSMIVVAKRTNSGVLAGKQAKQAQARDAS